MQSNLWKACLALCAAVDYQAANSNILMLAAALKTHGEYHHNPAFYAQQPNNYYSPPNYYNATTQANNYPNYYNANNYNHTPQAYNNASSYQAQPACNSYDVPLSMHPDKAMVWVVELYRRPSEGWKLHGYFPQDQENPRERNAFETKHEATLVEMANISRSEREKGSPWVSIDPMKVRDPASVYAFTSTDGKPAPGHQYYELTKHQELFRRGSPVRTKISGQGHALEPYAFEGDDNQPRFQAIKLFEAVKDNAEVWGRTPTYSKKLRMRYICVQPREVPATLQFGGEVFFHAEQFPQEFPHHLLPHWKQTQQYFFFCYWE